MMMHDDDAANADNVDANDATDDKDTTADAYENPENSKLDNRSRSFARCL